MTGEKQAYLSVSFSKPAPSWNSCRTMTFWEIKNILCQNFPVTHSFPREGSFKISNKEDFKLQRGDLALIKVWVTAGLTFHIYLFIPRLWPIIRLLGILRSQLMGKTNMWMFSGMIKKWLMGYNKTNSWSNKMCFVEREWWRSNRAHLCYSSVTKGPFTVLNAPLKPEIFLLLPPLSD